MKRIVFLLFIVTVIGVVIAHKKEILIPANAIRIRIVASSNMIEDQKLKSDIKRDVSAYLYEKLKDVNSYSIADNIIKNNINNIKTIVNDYTTDNEVIYGMNYFPEKEYKGVKYNDGKYKSLLIKLGDAEGENFWCVMFPPLCLIDENKTDDAHFRLFVAELIKKIK